MAGVQLRRSLVLALTAVAPASIGLAQAPGTPVSVIPKALVGTDYPLALETGYSRHTAGGAVPVAFTAGINGERVALFAGGSWLAVPADDVESGYGAGLAFAWQAVPFDPLRNPYIWKPLLRIQAGASYSRVNEIGVGAWKQIDLPLALGLGWVLPANEFVITPWLSPRAHLLKLTDRPDGAGSDTEWGGGLSAGLELFKANCRPLQQDCSTGWGGRIAIEILALDNPRTDDRVRYAIVAGLVRRMF